MLKNERKINYMVGLAGMGNDHQQRESLKVGLGWFYPTMGVSLFPGVKYFNHQW